MDDDRTVACEMFDEWREAIESLFKRRKVQRAFVELQAFTDSLQSFLKRGIILDIDHKYISSMMYKEVAAMGFAIL